MESFRKRNLVKNLQTHSLCLTTVCCTPLQAGVVANSVTCPMLQKRQFALPVTDPRFTVVYALPTHAAAEFRFCKNTRPTDNKMWINAISNITDSTEKKKHTRWTEGWTQNKSLENAALTDNLNNVDMCRS
jgi:hypothetical protein